jgi:phage protein D
VSLEIIVEVDGQADAELAQAIQVEVYERMGETTTYRARYDVDIEGGDLPMLIDGRLDQGSELAILVPTSDTTHCLVKGPVRGQQMRLQHGGAGSWVEVLGSDTSIAMDRETRTSVWADVTDSDAVSSILGNYDYTSDVQSTDAGHYEDKHTLVQRSSDLRFVRRLARRNGYLFWVTCDGSGTETAHFKRPSLDGLATAQLVINLDSPNVQTLGIAWDVERPTSVVGTQLDLSSKDNLDGAVAQTPQTILGTSGLQAITGDTRSVHLWAPVDDAGDLQARGQGVLIESDWFVRATCQTSLHALGDLVRAHTVVELLGAGSRYSGKYFVAAVRHTIDAAMHKMDVTLIRNGWGAE